MIEDDHPPSYYLATDDTFTPMSVDDLDRLIGAEFPHALPERVIKGENALVARFGQRQYFKSEVVPPEGLPKATFGILRRGEHTARFEFFYTFRFRTRADAVLAAILYASFDNAN